MEKKKLDINSLIGMVLLGCILLYWSYTNKLDETVDPTTNTEQAQHSWLVFTHYRPSIV